jgi:hypothetical protein
VVRFTGARHAEKPGTNLRATAWQFVERVNVPPRGVDIQNGVNRY